MTNERKPDYPVREMILSRWSPREVAGRAATCVRILRGFMVAGGCGTPHFRKGRNVILPLVTIRVTLA